MVMPSTTLSMAKSLSFNSSRAARGTRAVSPPKKPAGSPPGSARDVGGMARGGGGSGGTGVDAVGGEVPVPPAAVGVPGKAGGRPGGERAPPKGGRAGGGGRALLLLLTTASDLSRMSTRAWAAAADRRASSSWVYRALRACGRVAGGERERG